MNNYRSIIKTTGLIGGVKIFTLIFNFLKAKVIALFLGPSGMGIYSLFQNFGNVGVAFSDLGMHYSAVFHLAQAKAAGDDNRKNQLFKVLLTSVVERTKIQRMDGEVKYLDENDQWVATPDTTPVSMNFWGFTPDYFAYSKEYFKTFLSDPKNMENLKSEFFIPLMVDKLIRDNTATVKVLDTTSKWFGVTYPEDRQEVVDKIQALVNAGIYPNKLF